MSILPLVVLLALSAADSPAEQYEEAERLLKRERFSQAETFYVRAMRADPQMLARCSERLLSVYARLGRYDLAIRTALAYGEWLNEKKEANRLRLRQLALQLGDFYLRTGHARESVRHLDKAMADGSAPLPVAQQIAARAVAAEALGRLGRKESSDKYWAKVEEDARTLLDGSDNSLGPEERVDGLRHLVKSYRARKQPMAALRALEPLYRALVAAKDVSGQRDALHEMAHLQVQTRRWSEAFRCLTGALAAHHASGSTDQLKSGDLARDLGDLADRLGQRGRAASWRERAIGHYLGVRKEAELGRQGHGSSLSAYWRLYGLYQQTSQFHKALALSQTQEQSTGDLLNARMRSEQGMLKTFLGSYADARTLLREAVEVLEKQTPVNLTNLPRALNSLAIVEQATDEGEQAEKLVRRSLKLYADHGLPLDLAKVEAHNLLGTCLAQKGDYARAIEQFREGTRHCEELGDDTDNIRCNLLLNEALLHKAQGDLERALASCQKALSVFQRFGKKDDPILAAFSGAEASLEIAQGHVRKAAALAKQVQDRCVRHKIKGVLLVNSLHYQALELLMKRESARAQVLWEEAKRVQLADKQVALLPRTLNYLGLVAELTSRPSDAEKLYGEALAMQKASRQPYPATHFISMWRLARLKEARGEVVAGRKLLNEAVEMVEAVRLRTYGDAQQRASYLSQFAPAFEQLMESHLAAGDVESALAALDRSRSRTMLDQLQMSSIDPLAGIPGELGEKFRKRDAQLKKRLASLRSKAQLLPVDALDDERAKSLLLDFELTQQEYAELWREVFNASPAYRQLSAKVDGRELIESLREKALGPGTVLLAYSLGSTKSHVLLIGPKGTKPEAFTLQVGEQVAQRIVAPVLAAITGTGTRGLRLKSRTPQVLPPAPALAPDDKPVPLAAPVARALVDSYLNQIADPAFSTTRGLRLKSRELSKPVPVQRLELLGDVLVPPPLRKRLAEMKATTLIVLPDGVLHKMPLEALLFRAGEKPRYLLEELPPILYAPSASALALLAKRPAPVRQGPATLLSVSNPAYPQTKETSGDSMRDSALVLGLRGELPLLPGSAEESKAIAKFFPSGRALMLEGTKATEKAMVKSVAGRTMLHVAAHGFANEKFGNLFGALALTPPARLTDGSDDGFLSLHEIYRLPLGDCELAVLSACSTNVGPQRPLEAGVTLASGFLAAGARRVIASHWNVEDKSAATLIEHFFKRIMDEKAPASHAEALHEARLLVMRQPGRESPFHWAPFVLIGPP